MAGFPFELVSPTRLIFSGDVDQVDVPGAEGDFGVLAGHAPFVSTLRPGILTIYSQGKKEHFVLFGGFAEVSPQGVSVLAEQAGPFDDTSQAAQTSSAIGELEKEIAKMDDGLVRDAQLKRLSEFKTLADRLLGGMDR